MFCFAFLGYAMFLTVIFACLEYMNCSMFLRQIGTLSTFCLFMCYIPLLVNGFVECQFVTYLWLLKQRFALLNRKLDSLNRTVVSSSVTILFPVRNNRQQKSTLVSLSIVRNIHWQLCHVGRLVNESFALQILLITGNTFISFTTHAYYAFDGYVKISFGEDGANLYNVITTAIWTTAKLMQLFHICFVCNLVRREVSCCVCSILCEFFPVFFFLFYRKTLFFR